MNTNEASDILEMLMDGVDPISGEVLPTDHVCQEPAVIRALHRAVLMLRQEELTAAEKSPAAKKTQKKTSEKKEKLNAGRVWTLEDNRQLKQLYRAGIPMEELCSRLQRRERGLKKQLQYLGLIAPEEQRASSEREMPKGQKRAGTRWNYQEDQQLWEMNRQNRSIQEMAQTLGRSEYAVFCRLERWGLTGGVTEPTDSMQPGWSTEDTEKLRLFCEGGIGIMEMARTLGRTPDAIRARMEWMGLEQKASL